MPAFARLRILAWLIVNLGVTGAGLAAEPAVGAPPRRVYAELLRPREHPDDGRRHVRPPDWETFGHRTRFATLRGFAVKDGKLVGYREEIEKYTRTHDLGEVIWPWIGVMFASNLDELADEIRRRELFLFDVWGFVPGSGPGGDWQQYKPPASAFRLLEAKLGDRWLGMDNGEQDGRYIGGYASQMQPVSANRFEQYLQFQRHFERLCDGLGNRMSTLVSLNYGHYFLKEGVYTLIGAETAQGLPNGQVYYAFIRGAGKQYGVPWFGNASVWNRWGVYKSYESTGPDHSPTLGTSLSLLKRLLYSHILYNSVLVGFESGWFQGDKLSPIGRIQKAARHWVRQNGQPGPMLTPIALLLDFHAGWTFPRHLYSGNIYRVWGNLPYEAGDHLTDGVLDLLYPGYQDSSYFHDETGFLTATPYGDAADCLLSDTPGWLLDRYAVLVVAGALSGGAEIRDKLQAYVENGGHLVITGGSLARLPGGVAGVQVTGPCRRFEAGTVLDRGEAQMIEDQPFELFPLSMPNGAEIRAKCGELPAVVDVRQGRGRVTVLASVFGVPARPVVSGPIRSEIDRPLAKPYPLLAHVRAVLDEVFRSQCLFEAGEGLSLIVCRRGPGRYTLGVGNNAWSQRPFKIVSRCGAIESIRELPLDASEKTAPGYVATGSENADLGRSGPDTVAGGDVRIFEVAVREENVEAIPHVVPAARPQGRILPLRGGRAIKEEILARPTFFEHFDGVLVSGTYLRERDREAIRAEAGWIARQKLRVIVDLSPRTNLYPDLRLIDNVKEDHEASLAVIEDVLAKMELLGARDLVMSLHRHPENNFSDEQSRASFESTLRDICGKARGRGVTVHLRLGPGKPPFDLAGAEDFLQRVAAENLLVAPSVAMLLASNADPKQAMEFLSGKAELWLVAGPEFDAGGQLWSANGRVADSPRRQDITGWLSRTRGRTHVLDAVYEDQDQEYRDVRVLETPAAYPVMTQPG